MGMFDTIKFENNFIFNDITQDIIDENEDWQTKDLENLLQEYIIKDNFLYLKRYKKRRSTKQEYKKLIKDIYKTKTFKSFKDTYKNTLEEDYLEKINYHGIIRIYNFSNKNDKLINYKLKFTDGVLVEHGRNLK